MNKNLLYYNSHYSVKVLGISEVSGYFMRHCSKNDEDVNGAFTVFRGKLAEMLKIEGEKVTGEDWARLVELFFEDSPMYAEEAGIEMTFIAPKYVTILAVLGEQELRDKILSAQNMAVRKTLSLVEDYSIWPVFPINDGKLQDIIIKKSTESSIFVPFGHFLAVEGKPVVYSKVLIFNKTFFTDPKIAENVFLKIFMDKMFEEGEDTRLNRDYMFNLMNSFLWENIAINPKSTSNPENPRAEIEEFGIPGIDKQMVELLYNGPYKEYILPSEDDTASLIENSVPAIREAGAEWDRLLSAGNMALKRTALDYYQEYEEATDEIIKNALSGAIGKLTADSY